MDAAFEILDPINNESELVLERMRSGLLPPGPARELFGGHGTGAQCSGCDQVIRADQIEFEIHAQSSPATLLMHSHCMRIWYDQWSTNLR